MLITCPECELKISDKALACPHCGYPIKSENKPRIRKTNKRMRLPNGFGQISQLKGNNLRKPFRAMVTVGKGADGKPICKLLKPDAYFETYNEAYAALVNYNRSPYDLDSEITLKELYEKWSTEYFKDLHPESTLIYKRAWKFCSSIENMLVKDIRARHIKGCIDNGFRVETNGKQKGQKIYPTASTKSRIKSLFNLMLDYALEYEIVDKNYARTFEISDEIIKEKDENKKSHIIFTEDELQTLWSNVDAVPYVDWIIIQCYMGWRPQELATLRLDEVNINDWYACAGIKTTAGKQRIVPIHTKIRELVKRNYDKAIKLGSPYLLNDTGQTHSGSYKVTYDKYKYRFDKTIARLNLNPDHRPHDPRMTFSTRCKRANVDEYALKEMMGHNIKDITESVYTIRDVEWLREDLEKMQ